MSQLRHIHVAFVKRAAFPQDTSMMAVMSTAAVLAILNQAGHITCCLHASFMMAVGTAAAAAHLLAALPHMATMTDATGPRRANPDDPVVSVHNPGLLASGVPPAAEAPPLEPPQEAPASKPSGPLVTTSGALPTVPAPAPKSAPVTTGVTGGLRGRTAQEVPSLPKRSRVG